MDSNLDPKNEYFLKKEEKEKMKKEGSRERMMKKSMKWLGVIVVVVLVGWWAYGYFKTAAVKQETIPGQVLENQGQDHIDVGAEHPAYNSNPPTSGWHYAQPAQSGIYDTPFPDEQLIHNLEHGHIWIAYKPNLAPDQIEKLATLAKDYGSKIIMVPREANDTPIAFVAWQHLLKMDTLDEAQARLFIEGLRGTAGPEKNIMDFGFKDFRKAK
jgi:hypothetical protein